MTKNGGEWSATVRPRIDEVRAAFASMGPDGQDWKDKLKEVNEVNAYTIAGTAFRKAQAMGGIQARAAGAIKSRRIESGIRVGVSSTATIPEALPAFWGAKKRTGWNARNEEPNQPPWVTNTWDVGELGEGPYAINEAIAEKRDEVLASWADAVDDLAREAGFQ